MLCIQRGSHLKTRYTASLFGRKHSFFLLHTSWIPNRVLNKFSDPQIIVKPIIHFSVQTTELIISLCQILSIVNKQVKSSEEVHPSYANLTIWICYCIFVFYYSFFREFNTNTVSWMFRFNDAESFVIEWWKIILQTT